MVRIVRAPLVAAAVAALMAFAGCAGTGPAPSERNRSVKSGEPRRLEIYHSINGRCEAVALKVNVVAPPVHGEVLVQPGTTVVPKRKAAVGDTSACAGRTVDATEVLYKSHDGYRGMDEVTLHFQGRFGVVAEKWTLRVR